MLTNKEGQSKSSSCISQCIRWTQSQNEYGRILEIFLMLMQKFLRMYERVGRTEVIKSKQMVAVGIC